MKKQIRKEILALRKAMSEELQERYSQSIVQKVIDHAAYKEAEMMYCYIDAKGEVKTKALIEDAWRNGKKVAVPRVHGDIMEFYLISSYEQLTAGYFGIMEPAESCEMVTEISEKSVVIMPGVAFDKSGNRIGYGKGFYDKYFSAHPDVYKIAVAYSLQVVEAIEADEHDVRANCVITEN